VGLGYALGEQQKIVSTIAKLKSPSASFVRNVRHFVEWAQAKVE